MTEQTRTTLKGYFNGGDKPTESQFANFIDSTLINKEDGIEKGKGANDPLKIDGNLKLKKGNLDIDENSFLGFRILPPEPDQFSYQGKDMGHYSLGWFEDSWDGEGNTAWFSGYGGIKMFTGFVDPVTQERFSIDRNGKILYHVSLDKASSRELKDNIIEFSTQEAFETLEELNPVQYTLKADPEQQVYLGFIAEDVPRLVSSQDKKAITPDHIVAVLTKVVKEQQQMILAMGEKVKALEKSYRELAKNIDVL